MKTKTGLLLLILLILTNSNFAQQNNSLAPKATAAESTLSFWDIPQLKEPFIDATPTDKKDGILVGELGIDGGNKEMILKLAQEIADKKYGNYDSFLITHKGKLLFESYYLRGRINLPHDQASATKSYTSLLLGRAIQLGYLTMADLDKPLVGFLKDLDPTKFVEGVEKITLHQALTMRGGLRISKEQEEKFKKNPAVLKGQGQVQALLEHSAPITSESQTFLYGNYNPPLVMQVINAVVPGTAKDFIKNEFLDKMGFTNYVWETNYVSGLPYAGWKVSMTSRDMLKLGTLVINKGKWNDEQLISAEFLAKATSKITKPTEDWIPDTIFYGYFWYQTEMIVGSKSYDVNFAWGGGGQYIITVEELDLIVVITGHDREDKIMTQVSKTILPTFAKDEFPAIETAYFRQKSPGIVAEPFPSDIMSKKDWELGGGAPDMEEFYFTTPSYTLFSPTIIVFRKENNAWKEYHFHSTNSGDGNIMYSKSNYIERTDSGWSEIKSLGAPYKDIHIMRLTASSEGTYFFDEATRDGNGILRYSRLINGKHETPKPLDKVINTGKWSAHPFIAPDESYILWDAEKEDGYGDADLYISFRQKDSSWGAAINLGDKINSVIQENTPSVTPDGKYLFFWRAEKQLRNDGSKYWVSSKHWVDAQVIENLRPKNNP